MNAVSSTTTSRLEIAEKDGAKFWLCPGCSNSPVQAGGTEEEVLYAVCFHLRTEHTQSFFKNWAEENGYDYEHLLTDVLSDLDYRDVESLKKEPEPEPEQAPGKLTCPQCGKVIKGQGRYAAHVKKCGATTQKTESAPAEKPKTATKPDAAKPTSVVEATDFEKLLEKHKEKLGIGLAQEAIELHISKTQIEKEEADAAAKDAVAYYKAVEELELSCNKLQEKLNELEDWVRAGSPAHTKIYKEVEKDLGYRKEMLDSVRQTSEYVLGSKVKGLVKIPKTLTKPTVAAPKENPEVFLDKKFNELLTGILRVPGSRGVARHIIDDINIDVSRNSKGSPVREHYGIAVACSKDTLLRVLPDIDEARLEGWAEKIAMMVMTVRAIWREWKGEKPPTEDILRGKAFQKAHGLEIMPGERMVYAKSESSSPIEGTHAEAYKTLLLRGAEQKAEEDAEKLARAKSPDNPDHTHPRNKRGRK